MKELALCGVKYCRVPMNLNHHVKEGRKVPRKGHIAKRDVLPDPMYNSKVVTKLINGVMLDGKKGVAMANMPHMHLKYGSKLVRCIRSFEEAMNNVMPY